MSDKKKEQLGMNPSTASQRLVKDVLWNLIVQTNQNKCFHCDELMSRDTFSIEHKTAWLDSDAPLELYFDLNNISFSHLSCNARAAKRGKYASKEEYKALHLVYTREWKAKNRVYDPQERKDRYKRLGT